MPRRQHTASDNEPVSLAESSRGKQGQMPSDLWHLCLLQSMMTHYSVELLMLLLLLCLTAIVFLKSKLFH